MMVDGGGAPTEVDAGIAWLEKAAANGHIFAQRKLLVIKERNSKSMFEKLSVRMKIAALAIKEMTVMVIQRWVSHAPMLTCAVGECTLMIVS